ncbi:HNH endonuclease [Aphanizomenon sp. UHCC 0183]|uniref:HNH endonuclease n=1 Tax=Aphanizomenon TaxID=1175 RepID=UPI000AFEE1D5
MRGGGWGWGSCSGFDDNLLYGHIQPVSQGGDTTFENLCLGCRSCNKFKSN